MREADLEATLRGVYGEKFDSVLTGALDEFPTKRAALNSLKDKSETLKDGLMGAFLGLSYNKARRGQYAGQIVGLRFLIMSESGSPTAVRGGRDLVKWVEDSFPEKPGLLSSVRFSPLIKNTNLIQGTSTYAMISGKTKMETLDSAPPKLTFKTLGQLIRETETKTTRFDPMGIVYGTIVDTNIYTMDDGRRIQSVFIQDIEDTTLKANVDDEILENLFGSVDWLADDDTVKLALHGMEVLAYGRIFIGKEGQVISKDMPPLERDVTSLVVRGGAGWLLDLDKLPEHIYKAVVEALKG